MWQNRSLSAAVINEDFCVPQLSLKTRVPVFGNVSYERHSKPRTGFLLKIEMWVRRSLLKPLSSSAGISTSANCSFFQSSGTLKGGPRNISDVCFKGTSLLLVYHNVDDWKRLRHVGGDSLPEGDSLIYSMTTSKIRKYLWASDLNLIIKNIGTQKHLYQTKVTKFPIT